MPMRPLSAGIQGKADWEETSEQNQGVPQGLQLPADMGTLGGAGKKGKRTPGLRYCLCCHSDSDSKTELENEWVDG